MVFVLGIDGGGTSTAAVIADETGAVYAKVIAGKSNPTTMTQAQYEAVLVHCLSALKEQNETVFANVACCFAGLSGVEELALNDFTIAIFRRFFAEPIPIIIENDASVALYSGTLGESGVVQIAGTGAITYCIDHEGQRYRAGGWGYLIDDEGSGYYLAERALNAVVRQYDLRGPKTTLTEKVLQHFNIQTVPEIINCIYNEEHPRTVIAPLSKYVFEAAKEQDSVAKTIIQDASHRIIEAVNACVKQSKWTAGERIPVVLAGGVFTDFDYHLQQLNGLRQEHYSAYEFIKPVVLPIGGAVVGALLRVEQTLAEDFAARFAQQYEAFN